MLDAHPAPDALARPPLPAAAIDPPAASARPRARTPCTQDCVDYGHAGENGNTDRARINAQCAWRAAAPGMPFKSRRRRPTCIAKGHAAGRPCTGERRHLSDPHHLYARISTAGGAKFWFHGLRNSFITVAERELMLPPSLTRRLVNHARPNDVTQGYAADWTIAQLREPAQRIADRIEALTHEAQAP